MLGSFALLVAASWPILLSFDLWVFKDRSSFLNLDYLIEKHYRLGIDAFYAYGLLPVYLQHVVFHLFGRGYQPMVGCTLIVLVLSAWFWALFLGQMPGQSRLLWGLAALSPILLSINPNFPYSIVVLSIEFALYFVLKERLDLALVAAVVGCFSVPSLPLVLTIMLFFCIVAEWWLTERRSFMQLGKRLLPGIALYSAIFTGLGLFFGFSSIAITALPVLGSKFYKANGMGKFSAFLDFLHPPGYGLKYYCAYYVSSSVTWFALSTLTLLAIGSVVIFRIIGSQRLNYRAVCVVLCCVLQVVFICFAYGNRGQHAIYEPVLAAGTIVAISLVSRPKARDLILFCFIALGILAETGQIYKTWVAWRTTFVEPDTAGLYSNPVFAADLSDILHIAADHKLLMLSYATGVHHYFPNIQNPDVWFLYPGQFFPSDTQRMLDKIDQSDVIVEDLTSPSAIIDFDPDVKTHMASMHESGHMRYFRVWQRDGTSPIALTLR